MKHEYSRSQDPRRGTKREEGIKHLLIKAVWVAERAPRQLRFFRAPGQATPRYFSSQIDWFKAFDIYAVRHKSRNLQIQSSTFTNLNHKFAQVMASPVWPLIEDVTSGYLDHNQVQVWTWGYAAMYTGPDGKRLVPDGKKLLPGTDEVLKSPGWHYRVYEPDPWLLHPREGPNGTVIEPDGKPPWRRVAACDARGKAIQGWPIPSVLIPGEPTSLTITFVAPVVDVVS